MRHPEASPRSQQFEESLAGYSLLQALRGRRSRRFGLGMRMESGPLAYQSRYDPLPLSEDEEALLAFAACGITGHALGDLVYAPGQGGNIMAGWLGRTISSGDAIQTVTMVVSNDTGTYLLKRPKDFTPSEIPTLVALAEQGAFRELYQRGRVKIADDRTTTTTAPLINLNCNIWSLFPAGSTYFLPINDLTFLYINGLLEIFNETNGAFILDERANFRPAGLARFAQSKGGHLHDDPKDNRVATIQRTENLVTEFAAIEQGMMHQNLALMAQAVGLGGFSHFAAHEFAWFEALGFRMRKMRASRYLAANWLVTAAMRLLHKDIIVPIPVGLEGNGQTLLRAYCPPYYPSMELAVQAVVEAKYGPHGVFRAGTRAGAWQDPGSIASASPGISEATIDATVAYCTYIHDRYGRFPAYLPPFRTILGYQAVHVDVEFYDRYYRPEALTETQREHLARWHQHEGA
jgi:hypothetical protein